MEGGKEYLAYEKEPSREMVFFYFWRVEESKRDYSVIIYYMYWNVSVGFVYICEHVFCLLKCVGI